MRRALIGLLLAAISCGAAAQTSFSATLMSDYRYRGISLSGERPSASVSANVDLASGWYGGASVSRARMRYTEVTAQLVSYAGFARRFGEGYGWDAGVTDVRYSGAARYDYQEVYAGLNSERLGARVSVSPHYFGVGRRTVYTELNGSYPLSPSIDLFGHAGHLSKDQSRNDIRIGVSAMHESWTVQLAWVATHERTLYPALVQDRERRVLLSTAKAF